MPDCNYCHQPIRWTKQDGKSVPLNPDGSPHRCRSHGTAAAKAPPDAIVGRLDSYNTGSATFTVEGGSQKTYAITPGIAQEWKQAGFLIPADNHPDVWMEFSKDAASFIQPGYKAVQRPAWAAQLNDPTKGQIATPQAQKPAAAPQQQVPCTSPGGSAASEPVQQAPPAETKEDLWAREYGEFHTLLRETKRGGIEYLLTYLEKETDFFIAPSSTKYHDARDGGLLHHSLTTYHNLSALAKTFVTDVPEESLIIIGLLHDVCKANFYKTSYRNVKHEERPVGDQWVKEPYIDIDDQFPLGHGEKSTILLLRYIQLTDTEIMAIRWHMMAYDDIRCSYAGNLAITNACAKFPIIVLTHIADLSASFLEMRPQEKAAGGA